jgi:hypothetical protein
MSSVVEIIPKRRAEAKRGYVIRTRAWKRIVDFYGDLIDHGWRLQPMLQMVEAIAASPVALEIFGATSHDRLLLSNTRNFRFGDSTLFIAYRPKEKQFDFEHIAFSGHEDKKTCAEKDGLATLRLFLRYKYGILFEIPVTQL